MSRGARVGLALGGMMLVVLALAGCSSVTNHYGQTQAKSDAQALTAKALAAIPSATATPTTSGSIACSGGGVTFFQTEFTWRIVQRVSAGDATASDAASTLDAGLRRDGWTPATPGNGQLLALTGPKLHGGHPHLTVESAAGENAFTLVVESPCYNA